MTVDVKEFLPVRVKNSIYDRVPVSTGAEDSFGRLKVAQPHLLFDAHFQYSLQEKVFIRDVVNGAAITHNPTRAAINISCDSQVSSRARFRTRNYFPYSPAFTNTVIGSYNFHGATDGVIKRLGMFDEKNGYILEVSDGELKVGTRSSISGSPVTSYVSQANWNIDKMNGTGPSGKTILLDKQHIFHLQFQWLGSGSIIWSTVIDGQIYPFHQFNFAGNLDSLYSQTATLPIQAEILNSTGINTSFFEFTCCSVTSNGALAQHGHLFSAANGTIPRILSSSGISYPVLSIRKKPGFSNIPVQILDLNAFSTSNDDFLMQVIHKASLIGEVWEDIPNSNTQKDVTATSYTGGDVIAQFYIKGNLQASEKLELISRFWDLTLGDDFNGNSEVMTMAATPITTNATIYGVISFKEFE